MFVNFYTEIFPSPCSYFCVLLRLKWQAFASVALIYYISATFRMTLPERWQLRAKREEGWNLNLKRECEDTCLRVYSRWRKVDLSLRVHTGLTVKWGVPQGEMCQRDFSIQSYGSGVGEDMFWQTLLHFPSAYSAMKKQRAASCLFCGGILMNNTQTFARFCAEISRSCL